MQVSLLAWLVVAVVSDLSLALIPPFPKKLEMKMMDANGGSPMDCLDEKVRFFLPSTCHQPN